MIDVEEAARLAVAEVDKLGAKSQIALVITGREDRPRGWIFQYNSQRFVETGLFEHLAAGTGPIVVTHDGDLQVAPSGFGQRRFLADLVGE
jgi:hypothetical protein